MHAAAAKWCGVARSRNRSDVGSTSRRKLRGSLYTALSTQMRLFVAVTDNEWFSLHASAYRVDEVNLWRPSPEATFKALQPGELLLFNSTLRSISSRAADSLSVSFSFRSTWHGTHSGKSTLACASQTSFSSMLIAQRRTVSARFGPPKRVSLSILGYRVDWNVLRDAKEVWTVYLWYS